VKNIAALAAVASVSLLLAACGSGPAAGGGAGGSDAGGTGAGGGSGGDAGAIGTFPDAGVTGSPVGGDPGHALGAIKVLPEPGARTPRRVAPTGLRVRVAGDTAAATVRWYGGVQECYMVDSVRVRRSGRTSRIVVREGMRPGAEICPELAVLKSTSVDLGRLEPGRYVARAGAKRVAFVIG
jgi:hypothetical protein